uniref:B3 domain-containing protein Os01g0234100-like n=1 Tax=Erigeron canadensis TaxID=72917 RepID=UPI001CB9364B|nr:B3 domain-containing protein Os01g0234100-like [Erigeron canadensis]
MEAAEDNNNNINPPPSPTTEHNININNDNININPEQQQETFSICSYASDQDFSISQLNQSNTTTPFNPNPNFTPLLGKRRKSKPIRYYNPEIVLDTKTSKTVNGALDSTSNGLSSPKGSSSRKNVKSPIESSPAMIRAQEVRSSLGTEHPSCIKLMVKAHLDSTTGGYWMGFSHQWARMYLSKTDREMLIEDEDGEIYQIKYNSDKSGLSAGWRKFATGHNLLEGDALVFHLVDPFKFKVYIIRANDLNEVDGALGLLNLEARTPQSDTPTPTTKKSKRPKEVPIDMVRKKNKLSTPPSQIIINPMEQSGNDSEEVGSEVLEGSRPSKPDLSFPELNSFKDFHIMVNGVCIDSELPDDVRMNYYELCNVRKEILHDSLSGKNTYPKLVAGMIGEIVNIANEIKNCKITTTKEELEAWDTSMKSFSLLGMKVEFLRDRIRAILRLMFESEGALGIQKYMEAKIAHKRVEDEITSVTEKLVELEESSRQLQGIMDGLQHEAGIHEVKFLELVHAPW